jgi:hypothetical protein
MKKNFKLKVQLLKSQKWSYIQSQPENYFIKWQSYKGQKMSRLLDAQAVNIMTLEQLSKFLGY